MTLCNAHIFPHSVPPFSNRMDAIDVFTSGSEESSEFELESEDSDDEPIPAAVGANFILGGHDADFVSPLSEDLTCPICQLALKEPRLTNCGHLFCEACLTALAESSLGLFSCPICRTNLWKHHIYPDNNTKRHVLDLMIKCHQKDNGCDWVGELRQREQHNGVCQFVDEVCRQCGDSVVKKHVLDHLADQCIKRIVICAYCDTEMVCEELKTHHNECCEFPVPCQLGCGGDIARQSMRDHVSIHGTCPNTQMECFFKDMGCCFQSTRHKVDEHMTVDVSKHMAILMVSVHGQKEEIARLATVEDELTTLRKELTDTKKQLMKTEGELEDTKSQLTATWLKMEQMTIDVSDVKQSVESCTADCNYFEDCVEDTKSELRDLMEHNDHELGNLKAQISTVASQLGVCLSSGQFVYKWKIHNWSRIVRETKLERYDRITSQPFYISHPGHRMFLAVYPSDTEGGSASYVGVYLFAAKGDYDDHLTWPFPHSFALKVVDQTTDGRNISSDYYPPYHRFLSGPDSGGWGDPYLVSHEELKSGGFVETNTLVIELVVQV